ncbi:MAG: putative zinc-binding metallopeptidase [Verrucomicrobiota bacterium]
MRIKTTSILCAVFLSVVLRATASPETDYIDGQLALIQTEFNVQVHYQYDTNLFFPPEWQIPHLALAASEIEVDEVVRLVPIIQQFLSTHPVSVVRADLEHIYLLKALSFRGRPYGGTHQDKSMYIICNGAENRYDAEFLLCRLHSEFSSILFEHHPFPTNSWYQLNPEGFAYSGNGFEMLGNSSCYDSTDRSCSDGFLVNYCRSSLENDFNMISSWLFTKKGELDRLSQQHGKIQQKQAMVEQFYASLSTQYSFD